VPSLSTSISSRLQAIRYRLGNSASSFSKKKSKNTLPPSGSDWCAGHPLGGCPANDLAELPARSRLRLLDDLEGAHHVVVLVMTRSVAVLFSRSAEPAHL
jgi:hypothetical protein